MQLNSLGVNMIYVFDEEMKIIKYDSLGIFVILSLKTTSLEIFISYTSKKKTHVWAFIL